MRVARVADERHACRRAQPWDAFLQAPPVLAPPTACAAAAHAPRHVCPGRAFPFRFSFLFLLFVFFFLQLAKK